MPIATRPRAETGEPSARTHVLAVPFAHRAFATEAGGSWNDKIKAWTYVGAVLPDALRFYEPQKYSLERYKQDLIDGAPIVASIPTKSIVPHGHQREFVETFKEAVAKGRTTFLNADDVGLGKTIETWLAIVEGLPEAETVLVVCPLSAVPHWRNTIAWLGDRGKRVVVVNYDRLKQVFEAPENIVAKANARRRKKKVRKVRTAAGVAKFGKPLDFDVVVFDESHKLRNLTAARTKLAMRLYDVADFLVWLSATAGQTPLELGYLHPFMTEATGDRKSVLVEWEQWCKDRGIGVVKGAFGKWSWDADSPTADADLDKIRGILFGGAVKAGIRRVPEDIVGWPEMSRIVLPVGLEGEDRANYEMAWNEFRAVLDLKASGRADKQAGLVAALRFRQKSSLLRTSFTLDHAEELLAQGHQVALSVAFRETLEVLRQALERHGVAVIHGGVEPAQKEEERLAFQRGRKPVCLYTVTESISLHQGEYEGGERPRSNVLHDLRWSAIDTKQIEGRTHRDGRFSQIYWMVGEQTVEEGIADVVLGRMRSMSKMQGDLGTVAAVEAMLLQAA